MIDSYTQQQWDSIITVKDLFRFLEDPKCDVMQLSDHLVDINKSCFWKAANINFNFNVDEILNAEPIIKHNELSTHTMDANEYKRHQQYGYGNGYDKILPNKDTHEIAKILGFEDPYTITVNNQPPGALMGRHVDFCSSFLYEYKDIDPNIINLEFDKALGKPKNFKNIIRCFVALADWQPGQVVNFEPNFWTQWKKGDVVFFDWQNTPHATFNGGFHQRPFIKITGTLKDDTWVMNAKDTNEIKQFSI